jgi:hypothetical protein
MAAALLVLFLGLGALAAVPELHLAIHSDANHPDHQCAIKTLAQGNIELPPCETPILTPTFPCPVVPKVELAVSDTTFELLPPGRAPPLFYV